MKHPHFITDSYLEAEADGVDKLMRRLSHAVHNAIPDVGCRFDIEQFDGMSTVINGKFMTAVAGRDWKKSRINCTGFYCIVYKRVGRDEKHDENGHFIMENGQVARTGEPYIQYGVSFGFNGTEYRYRRRTRETIQDRTMKVYDYDDDLDNIDFAKNFDYLKGIH